jgi:hypothetical protein
MFVALPEKDEQDKQTEEKTYLNNQKQVPIFSEKV